MVRMMDVLISDGGLSYQGVISINRYLPINADDFGIRHVQVLVCSIDKSYFSGLWLHPGSGDFATENRLTGLF